MRRAERVVFALAAPGEAAEAPALPKRPDAVAPPGDDLVRIGLVPDVPDQLVLGRVEHIMRGNGQLDYTEPGAEVPAGHRHRRDHLLAKLFGELRELLLVELAQVGRKLDRIQQRGFGAVTHRPLPYSQVAVMSSIPPKGRPISAIAQQMLSLRSRRRCREPR